VRRSAGAEPFRWRASVARSRLAVTGRVRRVTLQDGYDDALFPRSLFFPGQTGDTETLACASRDYAEQRPSFRLVLHAARALSAATVGCDMAPAASCATACGARRERMARTSSENQIRAAREQRKARGFFSDRCALEVSPAEHSRFANNSFDVITAARAWHWLDHARRLAECTRARAGRLARDRAHIYLRSTASW